MLPVRATCSPKALRLRTPNWLTRWHVSSWSLWSHTWSSGQSLELARLSCSQERVWWGYTWAQVRGAFCPNGGNMERVFCPEQQCRWAAESPLTRLLLQTAKELRKRRVHFPSPRAPCSLWNLTQVTRPVFEGGDVFVFIHCGFSLIDTGDLLVGYKKRGGRLIRTSDYLVLQ